MVSCRCNNSTGAARFENCCVDSAFSSRRGPMAAASVAAVVPESTMLIMLGAVGRPLYPSVATTGDPPCEATNQLGQFANPKNEPF